MICNTLTKNTEPFRTIILLTGIIFLEYFCIVKATSSTMKKYLISAALLLAVLGLKAQQGGILYKEFDPPLYFEVKDIGGISENVLLDIDQDGATDYKLTYYFSKSTYNILQESCNTTKFRTVGLGGGSDTIPWSNGSETAWKTWDVLHCWNGAEEYYDRIGILKVIDGNHYYGWIHQYGSEEQSFPFKKWVYIDKMAFCTIPDYPLRWGQTIFTNIDENGESTTFATLHPNPTSNLVTVTGKNLRQAKVVNMLGQLVLSMQGKGNELCINLAALPAGVYFVTITNEEGRKCVRKVVKD